MLFSQRYKKNTRFRYDGIYKLWQALIYLHPDCLAMSQLFSLFLCVEWRHKSRFSTTLSNIVNMLVSRTFESIEIHAMKKNRKRDTQIELTWTSAYSLLANLPPHRFVHKRVPVENVNALDTQDFKHYHYCLNLDFCISYLQKNSSYTLTRTHTQISPTLNCW